MKVKGAPASGSEPGQRRAGAGRSQQARARRPRPRPEKPAGKGAAGGPHRGGRNANTLLSIKLRKHGPKTGASLYKRKKSGMINTKLLIGVNSVCSDYKFFLVSCIFFLSYIYLFTIN